MAVEKTPLDFHKPDGNELFRKGDEVISHNAQRAQDLLATARAQIANLQSAAGFDGDPLVLQDSVVAALIGVGPETTAAVGLVADAAVAPVAPDGGARAVGKGELAFMATDYGVIADGATDDYLALQAAADAAAVLGKTLTLPRGKQIVVGSKLVLPANVSMETNGAVFKPAGNSAGYVVRVPAGARITGTLRVSVPAGMPDVRGVEVMGGADIDRIEVAAENPGQAPANSNAVGVLLSGADNARIGHISVKNFDRAVDIRSTTNANIGQLEIITYVRGVYILDSKNIVIGSALMSGTSPNASLSPGHNGVLIESQSHGATMNIRLKNFSVSDSGEHGFRIGGQFRVSNVWHVDCSASNVGGSGFKALGGTTESNNYHDNLYYVSCIAQDCGVTDGNCCGFQIQYVRTSQITNPIVRKRGKAYSAYVGVRLNKCIDVVTINPLITDILDAGYAVDPQLGDSTNVRLEGGLISSATGIGIRINYTGCTYRRVSVMGVPQVEMSGTGIALSIRNDGSTGSIVGNANVEFMSNSGSGLLIDATTGVSYVGYVCKIQAAFVDTAFKNGSQWIDGAAGTIRYRNAGAWKVPTLT